MFNGNLISKGGIIYIMKYKIAICDDDSSILPILKSTLELNLENVTIDLYNSSLQLLEEFKKEHYDVLLLDIDMPTIDGFELSDKIKFINNNTIIVFITSHYEFIKESFKYRPIGFITKNYLEDLPIVINSIKQELMLLNPTLDFIKNNVEYKIPYKEIMYIKKESNDIRITTTANKTYTYRLTIRDLMKLIDVPLVRINKSIIVNITYIANIDYTNNCISLINGTPLRLSRVYKNCFKSVCSRY